MTAYLNTNYNLNSKQLLEVFDELPLWSAPFGLKLLEGIIYKKGIKALDIGFGAGFPLTEIAMRLDNTSTVFGIDPWEAAIARTEKKISQYNINNIEIIQGESENIPLGDSSIDLITSNNGLNNVSDLNKALEECARILKKDGQFIQTMNLNNTMFEFYDAMEKVLANLKLHTCLESMHEQIYKKRKPLESYTSLLEEKGFNICSVEHDQFNYKFSDGTTMLNHYFMQLAFLDGWKNMIPQQQQREVFKAIETELNKQSEKKGYLQLSVPFVCIDCRIN